MLQDWYAIAFRFDSHLGDFPFLFFYLFHNFANFSLRSYVKLRLAFVLWLAFSWG